MLIDGPAQPRATVVLAHGAGAPMDTPFMDTIASGLAAQDVRVVRFEFPYMAKRRADGKRRGPDRMPALLESWRDTLATLGSDTAPVFIGGKSMGGRAAATFASDDNNADSIAGVICLGYPFHPAEKPEKTRLEPLQAATRPVLVVQGERDRLGAQEEVLAYELPQLIELDWIPDGDHSFVPRKSSGHTESENLARAVTHITAFIDRVM